MKTLRQCSILSILILLICSTVFVGCSKEDEEKVNNNNDTEYDGGGSGSTSTKVTKPQISAISAAGAVDEFNVVFKVVSNEEPSSVKLYYGKSQTTTAPSLSSSRECRRDYEHTALKNVYYYKSFVMASRDTYVFYRGEATNSAGTSTTSVSYTRIR